jgi:nitrite reductase/ring-hydroxylating ferredoxin subunit
VAGLPEEPLSGPAPGPGWIKVAEPGELSEGEVATVRADGLELCLVHTGGRWAALDNLCPHQGGPLGDGELEQARDGTWIVRCPWHGWAFEALSGAAPGVTSEPALASYPVEEREDGIYVRI